jgi:hypothetical protein
MVILHPFGTYRKRPEHSVKGFWERLFFACPRRREIECSLINQASPEKIH